MINGLSFGVGGNNYTVFNESRNKFPQNFRYAAVFWCFAVERFVSRGFKPHCQKFGLWFGCHIYFR